MVNYSNLSISQDVSVIADINFVNAFREWKYLNFELCSCGFYK